jgi:hypothetical protein
MASATEEYFYYDADQLRTDTDSLLHDMSRWLELSSPLCSQFNNFHFSGKNDTGDLSGKLALGKVDRTKTDYAGIELPGSLQSRTIDEYAKTADYLAFHASHKEKGS